MDSRPVKHAHHGVTHSEKKRRSTKRRDCDSANYIHRHWEHKELSQALSYTFPSRNSRHGYSKTRCDWNLSTYTNTLRHSIRTDSRSPETFSRRTTYRLTPGCLERKRRLPIIGRLIGYLHVLILIRRFLDLSLKNVDRFGSIQRTETRLHIQKYNPPTPHTSLPMLSI